MKELISQGHSMCAGCGIAMAMNQLAKACPENVAVSCATGCLEVTTSVYPLTAWKVPWIHAAFECAPAVASGMEAAAKKLGKDMKVISIAGDGGCYSDDTEIFTENGFKNVKEIEVGERIWSVNPKTNRLEKAKNLKLHKYLYDGKLIRGNSKFIDFLVTPKHNVPIWMNGKWKFTSAENLKKRYKTSFLNSFKWTGENQDIALIRGIKKYRNQKEYKSFPMKEWLRFLGWYISEGCLYKSKSGYLVRIYQSNKENRKEILRLIKSCGIEAFECNRSVDFQSKQIYEYLKKECGRGSYNKRIPKWVLKLDKPYLTEIYTSLIQGDGSVSVSRGRINPHIRYITVSEELMNNFVELVLKLGMNCSIRKIGNTFRVNIHPLYMKHKLYSRRKLYERYGIKQISEEDYNGYVYCPQLDRNHTLIIKRNGKISLNGNTFDIGLQALSGMLERGHKVTHICVDNECYANCLALSTTVMTKNGLKRITEVKEGDELFAFDMKMQKPVLKKCIGVFDNGVKPVYDIGTAHHVVRATANHPFLTLKRRGRGRESQLVWKTLENLEVGDFMVALKQLDISSSYRFKPAKISKRGDYKVNKINDVSIPDASSPELMEYLGMYVGDGWSRPERGEIGFAIPEGAEERERLIALHKSIFGSVVGEMDRYYIYINSVNIARFIESLGFGKGAKNKTVPEWVFTLPSEEKDAFVSGLVSTDGYVYEETSTRIVSASKELLKRTAILLQTMGYRVGKLHWRKVEKGKSVVYRQLLKETAVGCICFSKRRPWNVEKYPSQYKNHNFLIGNEHFEMEKVTYKKLVGEEPTLDLRVEDEHNFIADGIVVHNTGIQRSGATPFGAWTTTTPVGKKFSGKKEFAKPIAEIAAAHRIPYVATASVAYPEDLQMKARKALEMQPSFLLIHTPCPPSWKTDTVHSVRVARLAVQSGMWVLYEIENGRLKISMKPERAAEAAGGRVPVGEYLSMQGRFKHLTAEQTAEIQKRTDAEFARLEKIEKAGIGF